MSDGLGNPLGMTCEEYVGCCARAGVPGGAAAARLRYTRLFRDGVIDQPGIGPSGVGGVAVAPIGRVLRSESPEGDVLKFTQRVAGRSVGGVGDAPAPEVEIESVLIPMIGKKRVRSYTLCVSSQVGCAMGCGFCQTAQMGLVRSLSAAEIVGQWFAARHVVERPDAAAQIRNIVFMGMGEPLDNLDEVLRAIAVLTDQRGPAVAMSRITVSTVGHVDGLRRLAAEVRRPGWHRLGLAVSLNAPSDAVRSSIMPINRAMPMAALREALLEWPIHGGAHMCVEYVLIPGVNDAPQHAGQVADFVLGAQRAGSPHAGPALRGLVNLIPYNPRDGSPWPAPSEAGVEAFMALLKEAGVYVKRRRTKGRDTMAACGQLGNPGVKRRLVVVR